MGHLRRATGGMSMVELVIASVIFVALSSVILLFALASHRSYAFFEANVHVQEQARRALDIMVRELHGAGGIITPAGSQLEFQEALGYFDVNSLDFIGGCPLDAVCWGSRGYRFGNPVADGKIRYQLNATPQGTQQLVRLFVDKLNVIRETYILASDISLLNFTHDVPNNTITIQLQARQASNQLPNGAVTAAPVVLTSQVRLRNPN